MAASAAAIAPAQEFLEWRAAVEAAAALRAPLMRRRVQVARRPWTPPDEVLATGVIRDVTAGGFRVRWDSSGRTEPCHPDFVVFI